MLEFEMASDGTLKDKINDKQGRGPKASAGDYKYKNSLLKK